MRRGTLAAVMGGAGLLIGVVVGFGAARALPGVSILGLSGGLSEEEAEQLIRDEYAAMDGARCVWTEPRKVTDSQWDFSPFMGEVLHCARVLAAENLISLGACREPGCTGGCCSQWIDAVSPAVLSEEARGLEFPCGDFEVHRVTSVRTEGSTATVRFLRTFRPDAERLRRLEACKLDKPAAGEAELYRQYVRNDSGIWQEP